MRVFLHIVLVVVCLKMAGQQLPMYNHYFFKPLFYNPAYAGKNNNTEAMLLNRSQWTDFNGAPQFNLLSLDASIKEKKAALALTIISDKRGINKRIGGSVGYVYRLNFNEKTYLQFGLSAGAINNSIDYSRAISESANDPALFFTNQQKTVLDFNAGFLFCWKGLEVAASAPQLAGNKINYTDNISAVSTWYRQERHYIASLKYEITVSDEKQLFIAPQAVTRIVPGAPLQYDAGVNFHWKNYCWLGAMYKSGYAVAANAGVTLNKSFDIGYSYEFITGSIGKYSGVSHEIMLNYKFGKSKKTEDIPVKTDSPDYAHQLDSLHHEMEISNDKIKENEKRIAELTKKLEALKAAQQAQTQNNTPATTNTANTTTQNTNQTTGNNVTGTGSLNTTPTNNNVSANPKNTNQNTNVALDPSNGGLSEPASSKEMEDNIWIITSKASECKTPAGTSPAKGYYVIAGTFFYQDFAMNEVKRLKSQGFSAANWIYSNSKQFNYVYIQKLNDRKSAIAAAKKFQQQGIKDAWVKILD